MMARSDEQPEVFVMAQSGKTPTVKYDINDFLGTHRARMAFMTLQQMGYNMTIFRDGKSLMLRCNHKRKGQQVFNIMQYATLLKPIHNLKIPQGPMTIALETAEWRIKNSAE